MGWGGATRYKLPNTSDAPAKPYGASSVDGGSRQQGALGSPGAWGDRGFGSLRSWIGGGLGCGDAYPLAASTSDNVDLFRVQTSVHA